jgi:hypothetical protein
MAPPRCKGARQCNQGRRECGLLVKNYLVFTTTNNQRLEKRNLRFKIFFKYRFSLLSRLQIIYWLYFFNFVLKESSFPQRNTLF